MTREVLVVQTGTANTASVLAGLERAGARPVLAESAGQIAEAERVVLPGVGALAAAMSRLRKDGSDQALVQRVAEGRPTLAICLGLQLLCDGSEESPGVTGLGVLAETVRRFPDTVLVPQMGWNLVEPDKGCRYLRPGYAYFANSFRLTAVPDSWQVAWSDHAGPFVAAVEKGDLLACQFHPELSGTWGQDLLRRWVHGPGEGETSC